MSMWTLSPPRSLRLLLRALSSLVDVRWASTVLLTCYTPSSREEDVLETGGRIGADSGDLESGMYVEWRYELVAESGGGGPPCTDKGLGSTMSTLLR